MRVRRLQSWFRLGLTARQSRTPLFFSIMLRGMATHALMVRAEVHCFCAHGFDSRDTDSRSKYTFEKIGRPNRIMKSEIMKRWQLNKTVASRVQVLTALMKDPEEICRKTSSRTMSPHTLVPVPVCLYPLTTLQRRRRKNKKRCVFAPLGAAD